LREPRQRVSEGYLRTRLRDIELNLANAVRHARPGVVGPAR
jgi:hypothetical protein